MAELAGSDVEVGGDPLVRLTCAAPGPDQLDALAPGQFPLGGGGDVRLAVATPGAFGEVGMVMS